MRCGLLALGLVLASCASGALELRLQDLVDQVAKGITDEEGLRLLEDLDRRIANRDLDEVEAFALRESSRPAAFGFARILIFRGRYSVAARITLGNLERDENPAYVMWKWWHYSFEDRPRAAELGRGFMEAIFQEFERGEAPMKLLIARVFRKGEPESRLSTEEFKQAIGYRP